MAGDKDKDAGGLNMDQGAADGLCKFFRSLPDDGVVRFFDRKDYYTVHGAHAVELAQQFLKTLTVVKQLGPRNNPLDSLCVNHKLFANILRHLLLESHRRVEVLGASGVRGAWTVTKRGSSGNIQDFEDELFQNADMDEAPTLMAVRVDKDRTVGIAAIDHVKFSLMVDEFMDDEQFSTLEAILVHYACKECIVPKGMAKEDMRQLALLFERSNILMTEQPKGEFSSKDCEEDIKRLVREKERPRLNMERTAALGCLMCLVRYLNLNADSSNLGMFKPVEVQMSLFMRLDAGASRALNLFPAQGEGAKSNTHLFGLLNHCKTAMGARTLRRWLKQPLLDPAAIAHRQDLVEVFVNDPLLLQSVRDEAMRGVPDIERLAKKFLRQRASLQDCVRVYQLVLVLPSLVDTLRQCPQDCAVFREFVPPLETYIQDFGKFNALIEQTLDLEELENNQYLVDVSFSDELKDLKRAKEDVYAQMLRTVDKITSELGLDSSKVHFENNKTHGHVLRVTRKDEKVVRQNKKYQSLATNKDGVRFTSPALAKLSRQLAALNDQYNAVQDSIVNEVLEVASSYAPAMEDLSGVLADLDTLMCLAHVAANAPVPYTRPVVFVPANPHEKAIQLSQCRHPCLEVQEGVDFIPNDLDLSHDNGFFHILTGPNMGGKSTFIRQIGVTVLLAQIGSFVPCASARVCVVDRILSRVGAADSQLKGVSTFMAEMTETAAILKSATANSLIVIDELGRGTSTYDGFGLAWAISEDIAKRIGAFCLFATHFHELTELSKHIPTVNNYHVTALTSHDSITMLYQVRKGPCDQSFGIHVAQLARFPGEVVEMAKKKALELEDFGHVAKEKGNAVGGKKRKREEGKEAKKEEEGESEHEEQQERAKRAKVENAKETEAAKQFLLAFGALSLPEMTPVDVVSRVRALADSLLKDAPAIHQLLASQ